MSQNADIDHPKELLDFIDQCLKPKKEEKAQFGEVFTPMVLVENMLDKLDEVYTLHNAKSVFSEKDFKWFDPANGMGTFPIAVYLRLMDGLKDEIKDLKERKRHILENMLYMSELNENNVFVTKRIFDINDEFKLNIYHGDTLKLHTSKEWNVNNFDVVMGNPPYNAPNKGKPTGNSIWQYFVMDTFNKWIKKGGYVVFVHPSGWRKPANEKSRYGGLFNLMTKKNDMVYLELHDIKDGQKIFQCGTRYDWYVIHAVESSGKPRLIKDDKGNEYVITFNQYNWLPNNEFKLVDKLLAFGDEKRVQILFSNSAYDPRKEWISPIKKKPYVYPVIHSTNKNGPRFVYSSRNDRGFFGVSKVIFGESGINEPIIDLDGKYSMSHHAMAIEVKDKDEAITISKCLKSAEFKRVLNACSWSTFGIDWLMFLSFKKDFFHL